MTTKKSFAKINLYLEVVGHTKEGYHLLNSLIGFIDLHDTIKIEEAEELSLQIEGPYSQILKDDEKENIIISASKALAQKYHFTPKLKITLTKNIPVGAGIGGGSSNCATILLMLNDHYELGLSLDELKEVGLELGADVPICLHQKIALVEGIGEKITDVDLEEKHLFCLIVNPNQHLSTKKVFDLYKDSQQNISPAPNGNLIKYIKIRNNHLTAAANKLIPQINQILTELSDQDNCLLSRMSGSGATCFGIFDNEVDLKKAEDNLKNKFREFYIKRSKLLYRISTEPKIYPLPF